MRRAYSRDLFDCIDLHRRLPEATARKVFAQVLAAVAYLQSQVRARGERMASAGLWVCVCVLAFTNAVCATRRHGRADGLGPITEPRPW